MIKLILLVVLILQHFSNHYIFTFMLVFLVLLCLFSIISTIYSTSFINITSTERVENVHVKEFVQLKYCLSCKYPFPIASGCLQVIHLQFGQKIESRDIIFSFDEPEKVENFIFSKSGTYQIRLKKVIVKDFFGIIKCKVKGLPKDPIVFNVYPAPQIIRVNELEKEDFYSNLPKNKKGNDYSEIYALKEYQEGDSFHYIHHALSAKYDNYIIKEGSDNMDPIYIYRFDRPRNFSELVIILQKIYYMFLVLIKRHQAFFVQEGNQRIYIENIDNVYQLYDTYYKEYIDEKIIEKL